jgi:hypothetical protein
MDVSSLSRVPKPPASNATLTMKDLLYYRWGLGL